MAARSRVSRGSCTEGEQAPAALHDCWYPGMVAGEGKDLADLKRSELSSNGEFFETWEATLTSVQIFCLLSTFGGFFPVL